jgi:hypothetical protein
MSLSVGAEDFFQLVAEPQLPGWLRNVRTVRRQQIARREMRHSVLLSMADLVRPCGRSLT